MTPETMGALLAKAYGNIVGVKDAIGKIERVSEQRITCGKDFRQLSGEDATALRLQRPRRCRLHFCHGQCRPRLCAEFQAATLAGDFAKALEIRTALMPLHKAIFLEPGLCGAKYGLS